MKSIACAGALIALSSSLLIAQDTKAEGSFFEQVGIQGTTDNESGINIKGAEVYGIIGTSWDWDLTEAMHVDLKFKTSIGAWDSDDETTFLIHAAPQLRLHYKDFPVYLSGSVGPTLISEDEPEDDHEMGGFFQFTSSIGIHWEITEQFEIGYSYQHTSNAGLYSDNDGLNMHAFSAAYSF